MVSEAWYLQRSWTAEAEHEFYARLKRSRSQKAHYLVAQAGVLAGQGSVREARAALQLLDLFFAQPPDSFHLASAQSARAEAHIALGQVEQGMAAYEGALQALRDHPSVKNYAPLDYAWDVARLGLRERFDRVLAALKEFTVEGDLAFPVNAYRYFGALAMISATLGDTAGAKRWATNALAAAAKTQGPFGRHPSFGVTGKLNEEVQRRLWQLAAA